MTTRIAAMLLAEGQRPHHLKRILNGLFGREPGDPFGKPCPDCEAKPWQPCA